METGIKVEFKNYDTVSRDVKNQIESVVQIWREHLGKALKGVYLHGSMALGCFREGVSDIDFLIVTQERLSRQKRLSIARDIIEADRTPAHLEMSAIWIRDLQPWRHPTPCQFHYSDCWTERYLKLLDGEMKDCFIVDSDFEDGDIACHVKLTGQCGICIYGEKIEAVFPQVPEADFWQSISADVQDYDFHAFDPRYFPSNILVLGRILSYKQERRILSKYEAGLWMLERIPEQYRYLVENALSSWYGGAEFPQCPAEDLQALRDMLIGEII